MSCKIKSNSSGYLAYQLFFNGQRTWEGTKLKDTAENRRRLEIRAAMISEEIIDGTFDYLKWFPEGNRAHLFRKVTPEAITVGNYYEKWILGQRAPLVRKSCERDYRQHFRYILPKFRDKALTDIETHVLEAFRDYLINDCELALKTARNIIDSSFRAFWRHARLTGKIVDHDPFADLRWPQGDELEPEPFTEEERDQIIAWYWEHRRHYYPFVFFQFWTGMRPSEAAGLRLGNIDLRSGRLSIVRSRNLGEDNKTKTRASRRTITLFPNVLEVLNKIPRIGMTEQSHLFTNTEGGVIVPDNFRSQYWYSALTALKIRPRKFYCTRHTFISVMLLHGENIKRVADYTGTSIQMIEKHYGRFLVEDSTFGMRAIEHSAQPAERKIYL